MIFAIGPAGSGKTYTAIALAVRALKTRKSKNHIKPSGCRSRRKTGIPAGRHEGQD